MDWKLEHRVLSLVKMGFPREEAETALAESGEVMGHDTLTHLIKNLRPPSTASASPSYSCSTGGGGNRSEHCSADRSSSSSTAIRAEEVGQLQAVQVATAFLHLIEKCPLLFFYFPSFFGVRV